MTVIHYKGESIELSPSESVLDGLLRQGHDISFGCRAGACQACLMIASSGALPADAQKGLSDAQIALNYFLACQCNLSTPPPQPLSIEKVSRDDQTTPGTLISKTRLNAHVLRLRVAADLTYKPGQYCTLWNSEGVARSYSLASHPVQDDDLEFHIKVLPDGRFSQWADSSLNVGDALDIQGPMGTCIYAGEAEQPLLLAAIGTGLAPIYGILKDAIAQQHRGAIDVVLGAKEPDNFYLVPELQALAEAHSHLNIHFISQGAATEFAESGDIYAYCKASFPSLKDSKVYLCGAESFVLKMRKQCFMSGAAMKNISADVFVPSGV